VRVFAAFPLPPAVASAIDGALVPLRQGYPRVRWVSVRGMHATVHFFGDISDDAVASLKSLFDEDGELRRPRIPARLGPLGQFPPRGSPRVIWAGLERGGEEMREYAELFEAKIAPLGWPPDPRGFTPHITVARAGGEVLEGGWEKGAILPPLDFFVDECVLFQSILGRAGAEYAPLARVALREERE
jgi:RNA 2',3'-cyclic 3'-phosphodiesterase